MDAKKQYKKIFLEPGQSASAIFASIQKLIPVNKRGKAKNLIIKPSRTIKEYSKEEFEERRRKYSWLPGDLILVKKGTGPKL